MDNAVTKRIRRRLKRNRFTLVNMGAETNIACISLKEEVGIVKKQKKK